MWAAPGLPFFMAHEPAWQTVLGRSLVLFVSSYFYFILRNKSPRVPLNASGQWGWQYPQSLATYCHRLLRQLGQHQRFLQASLPPSKHRTAKNSPGKYHLGWISNIKLWFFCHTHQDSKPTQRHTWVPSTDCFPAWVGSCMPGKRHKDPAGGWAQHWPRRS